MMMTMMCRGGRLVEVCTGAASEARPGWQADPRCEGALPDAGLKSHVEPPNSPLPLPDLREKAGGCLQGD